MLRFVAFLSALALVACDASAPDVLPPLAPGTYELRVDGDGVRSEGGPARYDANPDRLSVAGSGPWSYARWATVTLAAPQFGNQVATITLYADSDAVIPLAPGVYTFPDAERWFLVQIPLRERTMTPYRGTITVERVTDAEIVGAFALDMTTGGNGWLGNSALTATAEGRFHALRPAE